MNRRTIKRAVITGPTGNIGSALIKRLISKGIHVCAVVRPDTARIGSIPRDERVEIVPCDINNLEALPGMIREKADAFFHLGWAGTDGEGRNDLLLQTENIAYAVKAVKAADRLGVQVFIGAGSQAEYGYIEGVVSAQAPCHPTTGYGMAKLCAGMMTRAECRGRGIIHIWPRILSVYGPNNYRSVIGSSVFQFLKGESPDFTLGEQKLDLLFADDAAEALYRMALSGADGSIYPLGSGESRPLREYIEILRDLANPNVQLRFGALAYSAAQPMLLQADIAQLQKDTGFVPKYSFEEGAKKVVDWAREELTK